MFNDKSLIIFLLLCLCIYLPSCTTIPPLKGDESMTDELYKIPENCDFNNVFNASSEEYECSPKLKSRYFSKFCGILINAPKQVVWLKNVSLKNYPPGPWGTTEWPLRLMVAGLVRVQYKTLGLNSDTSGDVLLIAVN